jgi:hypothetical protein
VSPHLPHKGYGTDLTFPVSKGHGLDPLNRDPLNDPLNLNRRIFDHLDNLFPAKNGISLGTSGKKEGKNSFINGALGGTGEYPILTAWTWLTRVGSDYFSLCFGEHIPEDVDLVLIELCKYHLSTQLSPEIANGAISDQR